MSQHQSMTGFEKIRVVGKGEVWRDLVETQCQEKVFFVICEGSFGTAVLYRKKDDDSVVILKVWVVHALYFVFLTYQSFVGDKHSGLEDQRTTACSQ